MPVVLPEEISPGSAWPVWYHKPDVRAFVNLELQACKEAGFSHVVPFFAQVGHFSWPTPEAQQLANLVQFLRDVAERGLKAPLIIGGPAVFPNSVVPASQAPPFIHIGGHSKGETVNGYYLWWDVPFCPANTLALTRGWYDAILSAIEGANLGGVVPYVAVGGSAHVPFAGELGPFHGEYPFLAQIKSYFHDLLTWIQARHSIPFGLSMMTSDWKGGAARFDQIENVLDALPKSSIPVIDLTIQSDLPLGTWTNYFPAAKTVASDFRLYTAAVPDATKGGGIVDALAARAFRGWWLWAYKAEGTESGARRKGYLGPSGGWHEVAAELTSKPAEIRGVAFDPETFVL